MVVLNLSQNLLRLEAQNLCCCIDSWRSPFRQGRNTKLKNYHSQQNHYSPQESPGAIHFRERASNKQKQFFGIFPGTGRGQICLCVAFLLEKKRTHKHIPTKSQENAGTNPETVPGQSRDSPGIIPGQSREDFVYVFSCLLFFSLALVVNTDSSYMFGRDQNS